MCGCDTIWMKLGPSTKNVLTRSTTLHNFKRRGIRSRKVKVVGHILTHDSLLKTITEASIEAEIKRQASFRVHDASKPTDGVTKR